MLGGFGFWESPNSETTHMWLSHEAYCLPIFSDLESQDWHLAMAMQFQEGDECQVMDSCCLPPQIIPLIDPLGMDWLPQGEEAVWWSDQGYKHIKRKAQGLYPWLDQNVSTMMCIL